MKNGTKNHKAATGRKPKGETPFGLPIPTRFDLDEETMIRELAAQLDIPRSEVIKRACKYVLPKFASGELPLITMPAASEQLSLA